MLFTDEELGQAHQLDLFTDTGTTNTPTQEVPVSNHQVGDNIRYHGSVVRAHGIGHIVRIDNRGRLTINVRPNESDPWTHHGWYTVSNVRPESVTPLTAGVDYGDEPGVIDLFGTGQLSLTGV